MCGEISEFKVVPLTGVKTSERTHARVTFVWRGVRFHGCQIYTAKSARVRLAFPTKPVPVRCTNCKLNIGLVDRYCRYCGKFKGRSEPVVRRDGSTKTHHEHTYPVSSEDRYAIESQVLRLWLDHISKAEASGAERRSA